MALPTKEKTWTYVVNQPIGGTGGIDGDVRSTILALRSMFLSLGWTISHESGVYRVNEPDPDGAGPLPDPPAYWVAGGAWGSPPLHAEAPYTDGIRWYNIPGTYTPDTAASYIVFQNNALGGLQILLSMGHLSPSIYFRVSPGGNFSNGTPWVHPTAPDELTFDYPRQTGLVARYAYSAKMHGMVSSDGKCTRIIITSTTTRLLIIADELKNPPIGRTNGVLAGMRSITLTNTWQSSGWIDEAQGSLVYNTLYATDYNQYIYPQLMVAIDGEPRHVQFGTETNAAAATGERLTVANELSNEWPIYPLMLGLPTATDYIDYISQEYALRTFQTGPTAMSLQLYDLWMGSTGVATGDTYPDDGSNQFVQVGPLIFPWNGSVMELV